MVEEIEIFYVYVLLLIIKHNAFLHSNKDFFFVRQLTKRLYIPLGVCAQGGCGGCGKANLKKEDKRRKQGTKSRKSTKIALCSLQMCQTN